MAVGPIGYRLSVYSPVWARGTGQVPTLAMGGEASDGASDGVSDGENGGVSGEETSGESGRESDEQCPCTC